MPRQQTQKTRENKERRAAKRERNFLLARTRRMSAVRIDPISGRKSSAAAVLNQRVTQEARVRIKREGRRAFAKLKPAEKAARRAAVPDGAKTPSTRVRASKPVQLRRSNTLTSIMPSR